MKQTFLRCNICDDLIHRTESTTEHLGQHNPNGINVNNPGSHFRQVEMTLYDIKIREVHISHRRVWGEDEDDALQNAMDNAESEMSLEFSHTEESYAEHDDLITEADDDDVFEESAPL